eukprot:3001869-Karenia_brevis.AAC.1
MLMTDRAVIDPNVAIFVYCWPKRHSLQGLPSCVGWTVRFQEWHMSSFERLTTPRHASSLPTTAHEYSPGTAVDGITGTHI